MQPYSEKGQNEKQIGALGFLYESRKGDMIKRSSYETFITNDEIHGCPQADGRAYTDGKVDYRDTTIRVCKRSMRGAQLSALIVACLSLAHSYASRAGADGRSVRHCLLLVWIGLETRTVGVVFPTSARTSRDGGCSGNGCGLRTTGAALLWYVCESHGRP